MTAPSNPLRSTVFRLSLTAATVLALAAAGVIWTVGTTANTIVTRTTEAAIQADAVQLRAEFATGGLDALAAAVAERSRHGTSSLYYLADATGGKRAGNLAEHPADIRGNARAGIFEYRLSGTRSTEPQIAAGLSIDIDAGKGVLVVGRNIDAQHALLAAIYRSLGFGLAALALIGGGGGFLLSRHLLRRIDGMSRASQTIMSGDLTGRLPLQGSGDELDRLAGQLNLMLEQIERLMSSLREVSDNIAHDLKTPLNRLRNTAETALSDPRGSLAWREGLERTIEEADNLIATFNALLLIARLEAGAIEESFESLDLASIAADVAELYAPVAEDRGFQLAIDAPPPIPIRANRQLLGQAIANLIDNAIKYGAAPTTASSSLATSTDHSPVITVAAAITGNQAVLSVADRGPGIPEPDRQRALKRFVRLDASRTRPGTGLGLSLVAAVAQLHRGTIRLEDNGPGLRVILALPLTSAPTSDRRNAPPSAAPAATAIEKV